MKAICCAAPGDPSVLDMSMLQGYSSCASREHKIKFPSELLERQLQATVAAYNCG
jgi:hypothetical protein